MNILAIMPIYNEAALLPYKAQWLVEQGFGSYVIDNYSTDGSYEMLDRLPGIVGKSRVDTGGAFHLTKIQAEIDRVLKTIAPQWVVYHSCDLYFCIKDKTLRQVIMEAMVDPLRPNVIQIKDVCNIVRMPEDPDYRSANPAHIFYRFQYVPQNLPMIYSWHHESRLYGDSVIRPDQRLKIVEGVNINLGFIKNPAEREETYQRRKLAWDQGERRRFGMHFEERHNKEWLWTFEETQDIRKTEWSWAWDQLAATFDRVAK